MITLASQYLLYTAYYNTQFYKVNILILYVMNHDKSDDISVIEYLKT